MSDDGIRSSARRAKRAQMNTVGIGTRCRPRATTTAPRSAIEPTPVARASGIDSPVALSAPRPRVSRGARGHLRSPQSLRGWRCTLRNDRVQKALAAREADLSPRRRIAPFRAGQFPNLLNRCPTTTSALSTSPLRSSSGIHGMCSIQLGYSPPPLLGTVPEDNQSHRSTARGSRSVSRNSRNRCRQVGSLLRCRHK